MDVEVTYQLGKETYRLLSHVLQKHTAENIVAKIIAGGKTINIQLARPKTDANMRRAEAFIARLAKITKAESAVVSIEAPGQEV